MQLDLDNLSPSEQFLYDRWQDAEREKKRLLVLLERLNLISQEERDATLLAIEQIHVAIGRLTPSLIPVAPSEEIAKLHSAVEDLALKVSERPGSIPPREEAITPRQGTIYPKPR